MRVIEFSPPMRGIEGRFNTFRLGGAWAKRIEAGETVLLIDAKEHQVIAKATVEGVVKGKLEDLAREHAAGNHNQQGLEPEGAPERLIAAMMKRYGPHRAGHNSTVTVIFLRMNDANDLL